MKKILIISPIVNYGGREIELNIIAKSLLKEYQISILSTSDASRESEALKGLKNVSFSTLKHQIIKNSLLLRCITYLSYLWNSKSKPIHLYLINSFSKRFINLKEYEIDILKKELIQVDLVWMVIDLDSPLLIETIKLCHEKSIPCILRTTGTIFKKSNSFLKKIESESLFVHHSENNAKRLYTQIKNNYVIIDQCALNEKSLLSCEIKTIKKIRYGFLGRLTEGKGIISLLLLFKDLTAPFYIAGDGNLKRSIIDIVNQKENLHYLGYLEHSDTIIFFNKIDVLILASEEESGPLVGIEAMAAGKIVISTKVGAMPERFEKLNKKFWLKRDLSNLVDIISEIESIPKLKINQLKNNNRVIYNRYYSLKAIQQQYLKITKETLEKKK